MVSYSLKPINHVTDEDKNNYSRIFSHILLSDIVFDWSAFISETIENRIELDVVEISRGPTLIGLALVTIVSQADFSSFLPAFLRPLAQAVGSIGWHPLRFEVGILGIPLIHRPTLFFIDTIAQGEKGKIISGLFKFLKKQKKFKVIMVNTDSSLGLDMIMKRNGLISRPFECHAELDYPYKSFDEFYSGLSRTRRRGIRLLDKYLKQYNGTIEYSDDPEKIIHIIYPLFKNVAMSKTGFQILQVTEKIFYKFDKLKPANPKLILVKADSKIVAFFFIFNSKDTLFCKYCGLDYDLSRKTHAYFQLYYEAMRYAIKQKLPRIDFGLTENDFKKNRLKCRIIPITYWIDFYNPLFKPVKFLKRLL